MCYFCHLILFPAVRSGKWKLGPCPWTDGVGSVSWMMWAGSGTFRAIWLSLLLPLLLLELHVPVMHYSPRELVDGCLFIRAKTQDVHSTLWKELNLTQLPVSTTADTFRTLGPASPPSHYVLTSTLLFSKGNHILQHFVPQNSINRYASVSDWVMGTVKILCDLSMLTWPRSLDFGCQGQHSSCFSTLTRPCSIGFLSHGFPLPHKSIASFSSCDVRVKYGILACLPGCYDGCSWEEDMRRRAVALEFFPVCISDTRLQLSWPWDAWQFTWLLLIQGRDICEKNSFIGILLCLFSLAGFDHLLSWPC